MFEPGEKFHLVERRAFETDLRRHFGGETIEARDGIVLAAGYAFVYDADRDRWVRSTDLRRRIVSLADSRNLVRLIPRETKLEEVQYVLKDKLVVTDGKFQLDINEFNAKR
jgi:hypothetical protein